MKKQRPEIKYYFRGMIERGPHYRWVEGYSRTTQQGHVLYPWSTKRECQSEARHVLKGKAIFVKGSETI